MSSFFRPRPLAAGRYRLRTRFPGCEPGGQWVVVEPGRTSTVIVPLSETAR